MDDNLNNDENKDLKDEDLTVKDEDISSGPNAEELLSNLDKDPKEDAMSVPPKEEKKKEEKGFHFSLIALVVLILCILFVGCAIAAQNSQKKAEKAEAVAMENSENVVIKNEVRIETAEEEMAMTENVVAEDTNTVEISGSTNTANEVTSPEISNKTKDALTKEFYDKYVDGKNLKEVDGELVYSSPEMEGEIHMSFDKNDVLQSMYLEYDCKDESYVDTIKSTFEMFGYGTVTNSGTKIKMEIPMTFSEDSTIKKEDIKKAFDNSDELIDKMFDY